MAPTRYRQPSRHGAAGRSRPSPLRSSTCRRQAPAIGRHPAHPWSSSASCCLAWPSRARPAPACRRRASRGPRDPSPQRAGEQATRSGAPARVTSRAIRRMPLVLIGLAHAVDDEDLDHLLLPGQLEAEVADRGIERPPLRDVGQEVGLAACRSDRPSQAPATETGAAPSATHRARCGRSRSARACRE